MDFDNLNGAGNSRRTAPGILISFSSRRVNNAPLYMATMKQSASRQQAWPFNARSGVADAIIVPKERLVIFDADGTLIDSFPAIEAAFARHDMSLGDLGRFQKRRKLFKYLGGLKEFPKNLRQQLGKRRRARLVETLTELYRQEAALYPNMAKALKTLIATPHVRIGIVTRNVTREPDETLRRLLARHDVDFDALDFVRCIPLSEHKLPHFKAIRAQFGINPARAYACGDEHGDYAAAVGTGMHPFVAAYGFEDFHRLRDGYAVPEEVLSRTPWHLVDRLSDALDLDCASRPFPLGVPD